MLRSTNSPRPAAILASSRARLAAASVDKPPTHRGLLTPVLSVTRITYDQVFPRRITPLRSFGAALPWRALLIGHPPTEQ